LGQALGEFIELVVHTFPSMCEFGFADGLLRLWTASAHTNPALLCGLDAVAAAAIGVALADVAEGQAGSRWIRVCLRPARQPERRQRHAGKADAEFLQRPAARDRLGQALGEFIELVMHVVFRFWSVVSVDFLHREKTV
jgi:hypothetical protein